MRVAEAGMIGEALEVLDGVGLLNGPAPSRRGVLPCA
jgi:hypothetical protein